MTQMLYYLLCVSYIIIGIHGKFNKCPRYPDPKNGRMICDQLLGKYCSPECHAGFEPSSDTAWAYMCNTNTKKWVTYPENYPLPWPDCIAESTRTSRSSMNQSHTITNEDIEKNLDAILTSGSNIMERVMDNATRRDKMSGKEQQQQQQMSTIKKTDISMSRVDNSLDIVSHQGKENDEDNRQTIKKTTLQQQEDQVNNEEHAEDAKTRNNIPKLHNNDTHGFIETNNHTATAIMKDVIKKTLDETTNKNEEKHSKFNSNSNSNEKQNIDENEVKTSKKGRSDAISKSIKSEEEEEGRTDEEYKMEKEEERSEDKTKDNPHRSIRRDEKETKYDGDKTESSSTRKSKSFDVDGSMRNEEDEEDENASHEHKRSNKNKNKDDGDNNNDSNRDNDNDNDNVNDVTKAKNLHLHRNHKTKPKVHRHSARSHYEKEDFDSSGEIGDDQEETGRRKSEMENIPRTKHDHDDDYKGNKSIGGKEISTLTNKLPLVPVFSVDDLALLRHIVSKFNVKRSDLLHSSSSLWSKMIRLTSSHNSPLLGKRRMLSRKVLAHKDSDLARLIMNGVNKANSYRFHNRKNPFKYAQLFRHAKNKFENPSLRQYVFNGATFVPVPESGQAPSFLNSDKGGGLTADSKYRWNGATFVPISPDDLPTISEPTEIKSEDKPDDKSNDKLEPENKPDEKPEEKPEEKAEDQPIQQYPGLEPDEHVRYVFNGATFVPLPEGRGKEVSFLNTEGGGGLTPESKYRWNGATFVTTDKELNELNEENNPPPNSEPGKAEDEDANREIQRILDMWNSEELEKERDSEKPTKESDDKIISIPEPEKPEPVIKFATTPIPPPTFNPYLPTQSSKTSSDFDMSPKNNDELYYWDGRQYTPVTSVPKLAVGTMRYRKINGNFEQVDLVTDSTYKKDKDETNPNNYPAQIILQQQLLQQQKEQKEQQKEQQQLQQPPPKDKNFLVTSTVELTQGLQPQQQPQQQQPQPPEIHETGDKNSGVETRTRFVWNGATLVPVPDIGSNDKNILPPGSPLYLYEWTGTQFLPTLNLGAKQLYTWNGQTFVPYNNPYPQPYGPTTPPSEPYTRAPTTTQAKANVEELLGPPFPTLPQVFGAQGNTPKPGQGNEEKPPKDVFDAKINFPKLPSNDKVVEALQTSKTENTVPTTPVTTTTTTTTPPPPTTTTTTIKPESTVNPYLPTGKKDAKSDKTTDLGILLPPPNPYLPTGKGIETTPSEEKTAIDPSMLLPPPNPYLPGIKNESSEVEGHNIQELFMPTTPMMNTVRYMKVENPYREDEDNLEGVIKNDLDIKNEIEDLSKTYDQSPANTPVSLPVSPDSKLLESTVFDAPLPPSPSIDKVLDNDLNKMSPDAANARKDIDAADHLLQREEEQQSYFGPTAQVKGASDDDEATKQLKAAMAKIEEKKKEKETQDSTSSSLIDALSTNDKGKLEKSLQEDMEKLSTNSIDETAKVEKSTPTIVDVLSVSVGKNDDNKPEDSNLKNFKDSGLNVADLRELLEITRMAERQATAKKFGLTRPNLAHLHAVKLLKKDSVRRFLKYLMKRHALAKALSNYHYNKRVVNEPKKVLPLVPISYDTIRKKKEEKYENSIRKLVTQWNKSYKEITKKQNSALPKFHG